MRTYEHVTQAMDISRLVPRRKECFLVRVFRSHGLAKWLLDSILEMPTHALIRYSLTSIPQLATKSRLLKTIIRSYSSENAYFSWSADLDGPTEREAAGAAPLSSRHFCKAPGEVGQLSGMNNTIMDCKKRKRPTDCAIHLSHTVPVEYVTRDGCYATRIGDSILSRHGSGMYLPLEDTV